MSGGDRLKDKAAIVTGSTAGIGQAVALEYARQGAAVVVAGLPVPGQNTLAMIQAEGGTAVYIETDVSQADQVQQMIAQTEAAFSRLDVLVNNAGILTPRKSLVETTEEEYDQTLNVNLKGTFLCCKYAIPVMLRNGGGAIVNISSITALVGTPHQSVYQASKGGIIAMTRGVAVDHAPQIRANVICPGAVDTVSCREVTGGSRASLEDAVRPALLSDRLGEPQDIAHAAVYLGADEAEWVTGSVLVVDGGTLASRVFHNV